MQSPKVVTRRLRAPKPPKSRRNARKNPPTPLQELRGFLSRHGWALIPCFLTLQLMLISASFAHHTYMKLYLTIGAFVLGFVLWHEGHRIGVKLRRPKLRHHPVFQVIDKWSVYGYAYTVLFVAWAWAMLATWDGTKPSRYMLGMLVFLMFFCAGPWWYYRASKGSVLVVFVGVSKMERDTLLREVQRLLISDWTGFTSGAHISGSKLRAVVFDEWSVSLDLYLRRGASVYEFTSRRKAHLESACPWPVAPGKVRVEADDTNARNCRVRYMLRDPHAAPIVPDDAETPTPDNLIIGLFETGAEVLFELVNTLIAGLTRSGKSGVINRLVQLFMKIPTIAILGVDLTEGATELTPWEHVLSALARNGKEASVLFDQVLAEMERRGQIMSANGWKVFRCTVDDPFMVLIVDEAADLKDHRLFPILKKIAAKIGKYGGCVIVATQYPTSPNLPKTITANLPQKIGLATDGDTADRVIFGATATKRGFCPSVLITEDRKGSFLIKNSHYSKPCLARAHYVEEHVIELNVERWQAARSVIRSISLKKELRAEFVAELEGSVLTDEVEIVEADIVSSNDSLVLDAIDTGVGTPTKIAEYTSLSVRTVNNVIRSLAKKGVITQTRSRGPWDRA